MTVPRVPADALIAQYDAVQTELRDAVFPRLEVEEVTDDGETFMALRCPRCGHLIDEAGLVAVSPAESWDYCEEIEDWNFDHQQVTFSHGDNPDLEETLYYLHGDSPGHAVSLPAGWSEEWT